MEDPEIKKNPEETAELIENELGNVTGGVRTTGVDEVGLLTENRQPNKPPTGG
jgi:hypothetical protein